jgi:preprotein translocase subunit SecE
VGDNRSPAGAPTEAPTRGRLRPFEYLREVRSELRKVSWPNRSEVVSYTLVVLITTLVLTSITWGADWVISRAVLNIFE